MHCTRSALDSLYKECTGRTAADLDFIQNKAAALEESCMSQSDLINNLKLQLDLANHQLEGAETRLQALKSETTLQRKKAEDLQARLSEAETRVMEGELLRKKLHNTMLELKGNIRVFCRVRPILPEDEETAELPVVQYPNCIDLLGRGIELLQRQGSKHVFSFDKVFGPDVAQQHVSPSISQLVQSALDGYKVCIFCIRTKRICQEDTHDDGKSQPSRREGCYTESFRAGVAVKSDTRDSGLEFQNAGFNVGDLQ